MTGTAKNGKKFNGTYTIKRFTHSGSKLYAVGTLKGRLKGRQRHEEQRAHPRVARAPRRRPRRSRRRRTPARSST